MRLLIILFYLFQIFTYPQKEGIIPNPKLFSNANLYKTIKVLSDDSLEGRGTGTIGEKKAAEYLVDQFKKIGLAPAESNNSFYQYIPMHGSVPQKNSSLILYYKSDTTNLKINEDYLLYKSGEQTFIPAPIQLVFVGYGIVAPEYDYNDYQSVDVSGKIAVILSGEPKSKDENYFKGDNPTIYSYPEAKQRLALSRGAAGSIIIPNIYDYGNSEWEKAKKNFQFEYVTLGYSVAGNLSLMVNPDKTNILLNGSGYNYDDLIKMHIEGNMKSFPLQTKLSFKGDFKERDFLSPNIIGIIKGSNSNLSDSYLIVSAHYDHLGIGSPVNGDSIYNGASDNAMGVAGLLEIARIMKKNQNKISRSILFILLTGEEKGLLGSTYYTDNPVVPLYKTIADINIDGLAFYDKFKSVIGVGSEYSTLKDFLIKSAQNLNLNLTRIPYEFEGNDSFFMSDQIAFAMAGVPSILIAEGPDYIHHSKDEAIEMLINYSNNIYHSPSDDLSQKINLEATVEHLKLILSMCYDLCNSEKVPEWHQGAPFLYSRLKSIAEKR